MMYAQHAREIDWQADVVEDPIPFTYHRTVAAGRNRTGILSTIARSWERTLAPPDRFGDILKEAVSVKLADLRDAGEQEENTASTVFEAEWHLTHPFVDLAPFRYLAERFEPRTVLDVGCGLGATLLYFQSRGAEKIVGIDGFPARYSLLEEGAILKHDLTKPFRIGGTFDLVLCVEVVEHLDGSAADALLSSLEAHSDGLILFSGADEGQPGKGHRNCRPARYWIDKWDGLGWEPDLLASLAFRSLSTFSWLRRNPMILRRAGSGARGDAGEVLAKIGESEYRWYGQPAEIHEYPFLEDPPDDLVD